MFVIVCFMGISLNRYASTLNRYQGCFAALAGSRRSPRELDVSRRNSTTLDVVSWGFNRCVRWIER